ncbi:PriCT-2 domain-containing protein [Achromobacter mucicolens]|uniref:VapE domain-containing protein n=1 Tax=Achromobacter mucicolens TaxID=1389922 RepID=UPI002447506E|nr:VapE domain-containing protein [Achromobacter mucicolens]MDG9966946.1 PriCT-2 domain-containing protein [Achromobacter mucicolens]
MSDIDSVADGLRPLLLKFSQATYWLRKVGDHPSHAKRPLSSANLAKHLNGGPYVGVGLIAPGESTTMVGVLDFDSHKGETPWADMQAAAQRVSASLRDRGAQPIAFRSSGGHGIHLYCLWAEPQDAYSVRQWLRAALQLAGFDSGTAGVAQGQVEVFPKQDAVVPGRYGSMVIAPLAGASVPLDPFDLDDLPRDYLIGMDWPMSAPVPVLEKPERELAALPAGDADAAVLESALAAIKNEGDTALDYDQWRDVIFAIHHATAGADYGLELAHQFSSRSGKYDPDFLDNRVWPYIDSGRPDAVTVRTVLHMARQAGWQEPADLVARDFEVVEAPCAADGRPERPLPNFERNDHGRILATIENVTKALAAPWVCGFEIAFDTFKDELVVASVDTTDWRGMTDADLVGMRIVLERGGFKPVGRELIRDAVGYVADQRRIDSAQVWLKGQAWDGVPRVDRFLVDYMGAEDSTYTRAVSRYLWTGLAGRVLEPGVKADGVPIFEGEQGLGKSSAVAALVPAPEFYAEISFNDKPDDLARKMRGTLVAEIGELSGLHTKELETIKAFVTRTHESWTPKFKEFKTTFARRLLFIGTTNQRELLADETGNRRWLPVRTTAVDLTGIKVDRLQLWAEGAALFAQGGVAYDQANKLADQAREHYRKIDGWETAIEGWLEASADFDEGVGQSGGARWASKFTTIQVAVGALNLHARDLNPFVQKRISAILRGFGFESKTVKICGKAVWGWRATETCKFLQVGDDLA